MSAGGLTSSNPATAIAGSQPRATAGAVGRRSTLRTARASASGRMLMHLSPTYWAYLDFTVAALAAVLIQRAFVTSGTGYVWVAGPWLSGLTYGVCIAFSGLVFGLYERATLGARSRILARSTMALALGQIIAYACIHLLFYGATTRWLGVAVSAVYAATTIPLRFAAHEAITTNRWRVLCVGCGESIRKVYAVLSHTQRPHPQVVGYVAVPGIEPDALRSATADPEFVRGCPRLGVLDEIARVLEDQAIDEVIVGSEISSNPAAVEAALTCLEHRCRVTDQPTFVEKLLGEVPAENIDAQWFLLADVQRGAYETVKRAIDGFVAVVGLILTLPLWLLIALGIRLDSRGPVFFRQRRVGLLGREFTIFKFRTMRVDAERGGARWADKNDARVTRFGRFLRLTRLDELPQLWNILKGDMSLVGPRPERPEFVEKLAQTIPHYRQRHLIPPGLTGWAQINFGYGATVEDARRKLCFDLYYLKHRCLELDFAIVVRTIGTFLLGAR